jgi:hypothetical protein
MFPAIWLGLLVILLAIGFATDDGPGPSSSTTALSQRVSPVGTIARRVEAIRGTRFETVPRPKTVSPEEARGEFTESLDQDYPPARRAADEEVLKLLGLIQPGVDLGDVVAEVGAEQAAGYYNPRDGRLRVVAGPSTGNRVLAEIVLAHELNHALEDQRFELRTDELAGSDDEGLAYVSLVEGSASALMYEYARLHFKGEELLGGLLSSAFVPMGDLPGFLQAQLLFPYEAGEEFVKRLYDEAGKRWTLIDFALTERPPTSSEQIMHPEKYLAFESPEKVEIDAGEVLGDAYTRVAAGTFGEWQTGQLLSEAGGTAYGAAARGWGGDRYELWRTRPIGDKACPAPCKTADAFVLRWRMDSSKDLDELGQEVAALVADGPLQGAAATMHTTADHVTLAIAPDTATASRLARAPG